MKKLLCVVAVTLILIYPLSAQIHPHWGIKGGVNVASLKISNATDPETRTSFHAGALVHIHLGEHMALQPELMYSGQGGKYEVSGTKYKTNLSYLNLPVLFQFMTGSGFRLQTGPQVGFLLDAKSKVNDGDGTDIEDFYKTTDFTWVFGASYVTNKGVGFDARYNLGLSNINDAGSNKIKNRVFAVGLFYQFLVDSYNPKTKR